MLIDASAIIAVLNFEARGAEIRSVLDTHRRAGGQFYMIATSFFEAVTGLAKARSKRNRQTREELQHASDSVLLFVEKLNIKYLTISADAGTQAIDTVMRYGKIVSHSAELNFGDCFVYVAAKLNRLPLLFIGNDFSQTDVKSVLADPSIVAD